MTNTATKKTEAQINVENLLLALFGDDEEGAKKARETVRKMMMETCCANIAKIEKRIGIPMQVAKIPVWTLARDLMNALSANIKDKEFQDIFQNFTKELYAIVNNTEDNKTGMHPEAVPSGKVLYDVMWVRDSDDPEVDKQIDCIGTYETEQDAQAAIDFAEEHEGINEEYYYQEYDPDMYFVVLDSKGNRVWNIQFPTKRRAVAFILHATMPSAYTALSRYYDKKEAEWEAKK